MNVRFTIYGLRFTNADLFAKILLTAYCLLTAAYSFSQTEYEPPKLTCVHNITSAPTGTELDWTLPVTANPCFTGYEIYISTGNPNGPFSLLSTVNNPFQTSIQFASPPVPIFNGPPSTSYFYMINRGSCNNPSPPAHITSDTLNNEKPQPVVDLKKITIENNHAVLSWYPGRSPEVIAYLIYTSLDNYNSADTIFGRFNTTYTDLVNDPRSPVIYKIRAFETCENDIGLPGSITPNTIESRAMILHNTQISKCPASISLIWNPYRFGNINALSYEIQTNVLNTGFATKTTVNAGDSSFILNDFPAKQHFCVRIKANLPGNDSSFSNEICFDSIDVYIASKNDYIRNITVEGGNIIIDYKKDTAATSPKIIILYRSSDGIVFKGLTNVPDFTDIYTYTFTDNGCPGCNPSFGPSVQSYDYRINLIDSCSNIHVSDTAGSLHIGVKVRSSDKADIVWSGFAVDNITFDHFILEKITGADTAVLGTFDRTKNSFTDPLLFDYTKDTLDDVCYRITAVFTNNNDKAPQETLQSHSNIVCVQPEPKAFVPQAFAPNGYNKTFKPFLLYAKPDGYDFKIYDRWYHLMYSTNVVSESWDGTYKGAPAPLDGYIYIIKFTGKNDQQYTQTGTVMLLR